MNPRSRCAAALFGPLVVGGLFGPAEPSLSTVLARAGAYVAGYRRALETVVAEERYVQRLTSFSGPGRSTITERTLRSDFALVSGAPGEPEWMAFRDVLTVDDVPVRDRDDRLQQILTAGADGVDRARAITHESARYNLGAVYRTINVPTLALDFLAPAAQRGFKFSRTGQKDIGGVLMWEIEYTETARPTFIHTPGGRDVVARGSFWIDPQTGRVGATELAPRSAGIATDILVDYAMEPRLDVAVPVTMTEQYRFQGGSLDGKAVYTNYRRFETRARIKEARSPDSIESRHPRS